MFSFESGFPVNLYLNELKTAAQRPWHLFVSRKFSDVEFPSLFSKIWPESLRRRRTRAGQADALV